MLVTPTIFLWSVVISLVLYRCYSFLFGRPPNFPKGPPRIPLIGGYIIMLMINFRHLHKAALKLSQYYRSTLIGIYLADFEAVLVNDFDTVKEVLNRVDFDGRPNLFLAQLREKDFKLRGIFFTDGPDWKEQRRFILRHLRDFGFGRRFDELEAETSAEIATLIEQLRYGPKYDHEREYLGADGTAMAPNIFMACFANPFLHVVCGERVDRKDARVLIE